MKSLHLYRSKSTEAPCNFSLSSLFTSRVNSRFTVALRQFFTKCWAILLALMGTWGLLFFSPVSCRTTLQAFRLEWVKSIACTVSTHLCWRAESRCSISSVAVSCFSCSVVAAWCFSARSSHSLSHPGIYIFRWPLCMCCLAVLMIAEINWQ